MKEATLTFVALSFAILGFVGLIVIVLLQKPVSDSLPEETLVSFSAEITNTRQSEKGTILEFNHLISSSGFIDKNISIQPGANIRITARRTGDFFFIEKIDS